MVDAEENRQAMCQKVTEMKIFNHYLDQVSEQSKKYSAAPKRVGLDLNKVGQHNDRKELIMPKIQNVFCK